ncbi:MAG TPA: hypothetical protein VN026_01560 [Bacteroidia bacterium]|jgi:hypothetical protein|nr:hypothetical protein [Bacteroidia bacterium]
MRLLTVSVPLEFVIEFSDKLIASGLQNSITAVEDDAIEIQISYEKSEADEADELENFLSELVGEESED